MNDQDISALAKQATDVSALVLAVATAADALATEISKPPLDARHPDVPQWRVDRAAIAKAITDTLAALAALSRFRGGPSGGQVSSFLAGLASFTTQFTAVAGGFEDKVLKQATAFADAAGKATALVKGAVEGLTAIGKFTAPLGTAVTSFLASLSNFMAQFATAAAAQVAAGYGLGLRIAP